MGGCGDDGPDTSAPPAVQSGPGVQAADERVIYDWSELLSDNKVDDASGKWDVPAKVANGTPPEMLDSPELVREFNATLPCGAKLVRTARKGRHIVATFRLLQREGGDCGSGAGNEAYTAFLIKDGKIVEWLRILRPEDALPEPDRPSGSV